MDEILLKKLEDYIDRKIARTPVSKQLALIDKSDLLFQVIILVFILQQWLILIQNVLREKLQEQLV